MRELVVGYQRSPPLHKRPCVKSNVYARRRRLMGSAFVRQRCAEAFVFHVHGRYHPVEPHDRLTLFRLLGAQVRE